jgi:uncharacterized protein (DUF2336 family)
MLDPKLHSHEPGHRMTIVRRTGLRNRIRDDLRVSDKLADLIVAEWEEEALRRGLAPLDRPYWSEAGRWITDRFMHQPPD